MHRSFPRLWKVASQYAEKIMTDEMSGVITPAEARRRYERLNINFQHAQRMVEIIDHIYRHAPVKGR